MAENLWALREQKKLTVANLASRAGLPIGLIVEYESGQRSIDPRHLSRLARALYVEESNIKLHSDPRSAAPPPPRQQPPREALRPPTDPPLPSPGVPTPMVPASKPRERAPRPPVSPKPPAPIRASQIAHLETLLPRLGKTKADFEAELGKPIAELDRVAATEALKKLQTAIKELPTVERHRAYLPEAVEEFEGQYLTAAQAAGDLLRFNLFDGASASGKVIGFGAYTITILTPAGEELTLNKLALVSYRKTAATEPAL